VLAPCSVEGCDKTHRYAVNLFTIVFKYSSLSLSLGGWVNFNR